MYVRLKCRQVNTAIGHLNPVKQPIINYNIHTQQLKIEVWDDSKKLMRYLSPNV